MYGQHDDVNHDDSASSQPTHEPNQINAISVATGTFFVVLAMAIVLLSLRLLFARFDVEREQTAPRPSPLAFLLDRLPPEPRWQGLPGHEMNGQEEMQALLRAEDQLLGSYGWVDRPAGIVRIPIERAMDLVARRGLPQQPQPPQQPRGPEAQGPIERTPQ